MFRNYLTVALRHLRRHKVYTLINVSGLAIGIAFCILTFLFVRNEWTYDAFHENADRIYRVYRVKHDWGPDQPVTCSHPNGADTERHVSRHRSICAFYRRLG